MPETNIAHSDLGCMLFAFNSTSNKYDYLIPIRSVPATGGAPSQIEVTEMDSPIKQFILDRQDTPAFEFDYNYNADNYSKCKERLDGKTENKFLIVYSDKSGVKFSGVGTTWRDAVSTGAEIKGKTSIAVCSVEDVADCSSIVDISTIPAGRKHPFSTSTFTVEFNENGGSGTAVSDMTCTVGSYIILPSCDFTSSEDDFNSWNTRADGTGTDYLPGQKFYASADTTLYAKY